MSRKNKNAQDLVRITSAVRRLFHRMSTAWAGVLDDMQVTAQMRAVMESLAQGEKTVPQIAREKEVSRQHVQMTVNQLLDLEVAQRNRNPASARSPIISLSPMGNRVWESIAQREARLIPTLAKQLTAFPLDQTADTLEYMIDFFGSVEFDHLVALSKRDPKRSSKSRK